MQELNLIEGLMFKSKEYEYVRIITNNFDLHYRELVFKNFYKDLFYNDLQAECFNVMLLKKFIKILAQFRFKFKQYFYIRISFVVLF